MFENINYQHELISEASKALRERNTYKLELLKDKNEGWIQGDAERNAVNSMIAAMIDSIEEIELCEGGERW